MPSLPPPHLIVDVLLYAVLPAALTAAVLMAAVVLVGGVRLAPLGAALGLAAGCALGLWIRDALTLISGDSAWNRLPWAALAAVVLGLAFRLPWVSTAMGYRLQGAAAVVLAWWVIPAETVEALPWAVPVFGVVVLAEWALLEYLAERPPGGTVPLALALSAFVAAAVLIHAGTARLTEAATVLSAALGGIGLVSCWRRVDGGGAVPGAAVLLPGVLLMGQQTTYGIESWHAFALAAAAPLMLVLTLPLASWRGWGLRLVRLMLLLAPLAGAVALAMEAGPLEFE